jgi:hypothetical protein
MIRVVMFAGGEIYHSLFLVLKWMVQMLAYYVVKDSIYCGLPMEPQFMRAVPLPVGSKT